MRSVIGITLLLALTPSLSLAGDPKNSKKTTAPAAPTIGIRTPGIQIPFSTIKSELTYEPSAPPAWIAATDSILVPSKDGLQRIDPKGKEAKFGDAIAGLNQPCAGVVSAFTSLWAPSCGAGAIVRFDAKGAKVTANLPVGAGPAKSGIAASSDSIWAFTDAKGTISRIDN